MSLPLIADTAAEVHRLTIAGSALAAGDFRLQKLLPQLESLGAKAPVFSRIAQGVRAVTDETDAAKAGRALLDLSTLLTAIQYTQSQHGADGDFTPINTAAQSWTPTATGYRSLAAVVEALTSTGEGRLEVIRDAAQRGLFKDLRLMQPAVTALNDRFGELADFVTEHALPQFGPAIIPLLKAGFDPKGGNAHARRLRALCAVDKEEGRAFCRAALDEARKEVKVAIIAALKDSSKDFELLRTFTKDKSKEVRAAAIFAISESTDSRAQQSLTETFKGKDAQIAFYAAAKGAELPLEVFEAACLHLSGTDESGLISEATMSAISALAGMRTGYGDTRTQEFLKRCLNSAQVMSHQYTGSSIARAVYYADAVALDMELLRIAINLSDQALEWAFMTGYRRLPPDRLFHDLVGIYRKTPSGSSLDRMFFGVGSAPFSPDMIDTLHPGWTKAAIEKGAGLAVSKIAKVGDLEAREFLVAENAAWTGHHAGRIDMYATAIVRIAPALAADFLMARIEERFLNHSRYLLDAERLFELLETLPVSEADMVKSRGAILTDDWRVRFLKALRRMAAKT